VNRIFAHLKKVFLLYHASKKYLSDIKMKKTIFLTVIIVFVFLKASAQSLPKVKMETSLGVIIVEVDTIKAPVSALNFLKHVKEGSYRDAVFYRVVRMNNQPQNDVKIEVIQGGVFIDERIEKLAPIAHETTKQTGIKHLNGTISMARMGPGTASSEFFICVNDQPELDFGGKRNPDGQGFAAFGQVVKGMGVVREIQKQKDKNQMLVKKLEIKMTIIR